ncbi:MAG: diphosphate--fructose-6-phosphate 1-phosphotransferase [Desulfurispora sp.]|uniref:diphosphate--fructose-6-phosphate 1-phosphotransferase n=1 Tax=Desulfurispora sp. TaxID=3014275 RepID=UPI00404921E2
MTAAGDGILVVAQTGGPSAVINSTLAGIIAESRECGRIKQVLGSLYGLEGLLQGRLVDLTGLGAEQLDRLRRTPAAFLGSSRLALREEDFPRLAGALKKLRADYFLQIGGNGTMYAAHRLAQAARTHGCDLQVIGVPKTVDNDIAGMDHTPGYGSAARYVAQVTQDLGLDLYSMRTFEQVRVLEVMGRNVGWLAAASALGKEQPWQAPHLIYLPEHPLDVEEMVREVRAVYQEYGFAVVVVGEGVRGADGRPLGNRPFARIKQGSQVYGGAAAYLAGVLAERLELRVRSQELGMAQRCFAAYRSSRDEQEAYQVGRAAVQAALVGQGDHMVRLEGSPLPLEQVGGREKKVPVSFYDSRSKQVTGEFLRWLAPLTGAIADNYLCLFDLA